jgi:putative aldouronate transport system permease protein
LQSVWKYTSRNRFLYMLLVPVVLYLIVFKYAPMAGEIIAFKNYRLADGLWGSPWVGLEQFEKLFSSRDFYNVLKNTLLLNLYTLMFSFPAPIILALMLNEVRVEWYKRTLQNLLYIPHFISWIVLGSIIYACYRHLLVF